MKSEMQKAIESHIEEAITSMSDEDRREFVARIAGMHEHEVICDSEGPSYPAEPFATAEDKLRLISDTVEQQAPQGSDLANFRRRLRLILDL